MPPTDVTKLTDVELKRLLFLLEEQAKNNNPKIKYPAHEAIDHSHIRKSADLKHLLGAGTANHQAHVTESLTHLHQVVMELVDHVQLPDPHPRPADDRKENPVAAAAPVDPPELAAQLKAAQENIRKAYQANMAAKGGGN